MDRVILTWLSQQKLLQSIASRFKSCHNGIVATFRCDFDEPVGIGSVPFQIRSRIEQQSNNLGVPL